jgi:hypothetical protein
MRTRIAFPFRVNEWFRHPPWTEMIREILAFFGFVWLVLELATWVAPSVVKESNRPIILVIAFVIAFILGVLRTLPPTQSVKRFPSKSVEVELVVGNILEPSSDHNIAVLSSDYFDSCVNTAISVSSLKGKLIATFFAGVNSVFDTAVDNSLRSQGIAGLHNATKNRGKNRLQQYPIGTVAVVPVGIRRVLVVVASTFDDISSKTTTTASALWLSLLALWSTALTQGHREPIATPIWGANLGCAPGNRLVLFQTILCSFAATCASQNQPPTKHLKIVVWEGDYEPNEFREMVNVLQHFEI